MRHYLMGLTAALAVAACEPRVTEPQQAQPVAVADTTIRITAKAPSMWLVRTDSAFGNVAGMWLLGSVAPFDTARVAGRDSTVLFATKLDTRGFPLCTDTRPAKRGEIVTLTC